MTHANPLQPTGAPPTVPDEMQKSATEIENATGYDLEQMLAGRRANDHPAKRMRPRDCHESYGPGEWTLSRVLTSGHRMSERSLQQLAKSLFDGAPTPADIADVRRAYSVTVQRLAPREART